MWLGGIGDDDAHDFDRILLLIDRTRHRVSPHQRFRMGKPFRHHRRPVADLINAGLRRAKGEGLHVSARAGRESAAEGRQRPLRKMGWFPHVSASPEHRTGRLYLPTGGQRRQGQLRRIADIQVVGIGCPSQVIDMKVQAERITCL